MILVAQIKNDAYPSRLCSNSATGILGVCSTPTSENFTLVSHCRKFEADPAGAIMGEYAAKTAL